MTRLLAYRRRMRACAAIACLLAVGCGALSIPEVERSRPSTHTPENAAIVLFVLGSSDDAPALRTLPRAWPALDPPFATAVDVLDESGELLGRLGRRSWLEIERPPGPATFYAVSSTWAPCDNLVASHCPPSRGMADAGMIRAELEAGRIYAVWLGTLTTRGAGLDLDPPCLRWQEEDSMFPARVTHDLVAVRGAAWAHVDHVLAHRDARAMRPAPRGLEHPHGEAARASAEARVGRCWDPHLSTLEPSDGRARLDESTALP